MKILNDTIWGNCLWFDSKCAPLSLKWEAGSWGMISKVRGNVVSEDGGIMIRWFDWYLWRLRTTLWYDLESTESRDCFTHKLQSHCPPWTWKTCTAELAFVGHSSSKMALLDHTRLSVSAASLTSNRGMKALLCSCFSLSTLSLTHKTRMSKPIHQPRTRPTGIVSESLFFPRWQPWVEPRLRVGPCEASTLHPAGVAQFSVLDSLFCLPFLFFLFLGSLYQPDLFCWTLFSYSWNTQSAIQRCWIWWECTRLWRWVPCGRMGSWKWFRARQHHCHLRPSLTKESLPFFCIFDRGSSGEQSDSLRLCLDRRKNDHKRIWPTL